MEDKMVEIAHFGQAAEAEMLANLLQSEGVDCYVRDGISSRALFGVADIGGAKVELLGKDAGRAAQIMRDHGYEVPAETLELTAPGNSPEDDAALGQSNKRLAKRMSAILLLMLLLLAAIIILNRHFNGTAL